MRRLRLLLPMLCVPMVLLPESGPAGANVPGTPRPMPDARGNGLPELQPRLGRLKLKHDNMIIAAVFAPDGKTVATAGWDNLIRLWDAGTGRELRRFTGHGKAVYGVAFTADGKLLASGSEDRSIRIWDVATAKELRRFEGHQAGVTKVGFTPDGKRLASSGYDQTVRVWDAVRGKELYKLGGQQRGFTSFAVSPDGKHLATATADNSLRLLQLVDGKEVRFFRGHQNAIIGVAFSPDGRFLATASEDQTVRLWHATTGRPLRQLIGHSGGVWAVAFSPDGRYLASAGRDKRVRVWEVLTGGPVRMTEAHADGIPTLDFSADGQLVISGSHDASAVLWDWSAGRPADVHPESLLPEEELTACWEALGRDEAVAAQRTVWQLAAARPSVTFLRNQLRPVPRLEADRLGRLLADLDSDTFAVRHRASAALQSLGELAEPSLRDRLDAQPSPEVRQRVDRLLDKLDAPALKPEQLRALRGLEVLEHAGTPEARKLLEALAAGAPGARYTEEAKWILRRWPRP